MPRLMRCVVALFIVCSGCADNLNPSEQDVGQKEAAVSASTTDPVPQQVEPIFNQTQRLPNEIYVAPSATVPLTPGYRLDITSDLSLLNQPFIVQKLTERTYFVEINFFSSTVYVGDHGVLVIDAPALTPNDGQALIDAVASITPLPIKRLVYSHPHTDHNGSGVFLRQHIPNLKIIGTKWLDDTIARYGLPLARPDIIIRKRVASFRFEGKRFRILTPEPAAHTLADSYIITPDRVLHAADFVQPGRLTFVESSVVMNMEGYIRVLRFLAGEEGNYDFANWGHVNVGYASDVDRLLGYFQTYYTSWWDALQQLPFEDFIDPTQDNSIVWVRNWFDAMSLELFSRVVPEYGHVPYIESARDSAANVHEDMFLSRLNAADPSSFGNIPSFEPIPPPYEDHGCDDDDHDHEHDHDE